MDKMVGLLEDSRKSSGNDVTFDANAYVLHMTPHVSNRVCLCAGH